MNNNNLQDGHIGGKEKVDVSKTMQYYPTSKQQYSKPVLVFGSQWSKVSVV